MPRLTSQKLKPYGASIFDLIGREVRARPHVVNLGQGFPDFDGPELIKDAAYQAMRDGNNQYAPLPGVPGLTQVIAEIYRERTGIEFDPAREITVLCGATEAMYAALTALTDPGDEWIVFAPIYDTYVPTLQLAGARCIEIPLEPPHWRFDPERLRAAFGPKTRGVVINTPHNPTGTVFNREELELIRDLCVAHDAIAVADEVYENLVFEGEHISIAGLEGMRERTVTVSSTGKSFSMTGWKIGWTVAPPEATEAIRRIHQFIAFAIATPFQFGMAAALRNRETLLPELRNHLAKQRDILCSELAQIGFAVEKPSGTYFALADFRKFSSKPDTEYVLELITSEIGVASIPLSVFYMDQAQAPTNYIRFCFAKRDQTLRAGLDRLHLLRS